MGRYTACGSEIPKRVRDDTRGGIWDDMCGGIWDDIRGVFDLQCMG